MKRTAVYAGTFDPPTLGHLWMIHESSRLFDEVIVAIGINPDKKALFSLNDRTDMLNEIVATFSNVRVASFVNQYLIHYAVSVQADFIVRGIRNMGDYEYEKAMRHINGDLGKTVTTVFLMPPREIAEVSSSVVKGLIGPHGWERMVSTYVPDGVLKKLIAARQTLWKNLVERGAHGDEAQFWNELLTPYMDSTRAYHSWRHITDLVTDFNEVRNLATDPVAVEMAIWYHDFVYETAPEKSSRSESNEQRSADKAREAIKKAGLPESFANQVALLILATQHVAEPTNSDARLLVDLDLAILGKPETEFDEYEAGIRKEYGWVPWETFTAGRAEILESLLKRKSVYSTQFFRDKYEALARKNLIRSIKVLRK